MSFSPPSNFNPKRAAAIRPLAGGEAGFNPTDIRYNTLPISEYFWHRPHIAVRLLLENMNLPRLVQELAPFLIYASGDIPLGTDPTKIAFQNVLLQVEPGVFIELHEKDAIVHAETQKEVTHWVNQLANWHQQHQTQLREAEFYLLKSSFGSIDAHPVTIRSDQTLAASELSLNYGSAFPQWEENFIATLQNGATGATILRGEPGTGKTTFLRHLLSKLMDTHVFYYLPSRFHSLLSSPDLVEFWMREKNSTSRSRCLIVEDAEALLAERANDNRDAVSDILNIADGLMGDYLDMHLIFTVNCRLDRIDPAILRRGRLIGFHEFRRLSQQEGQDLAHAKGLTIQPMEDYSLADIYHSHSAIDTENSLPIGFTQ